MNQQATDPQQQAQQQLMDALLTCHYQMSASKEHEQRIERVMQAINPHRVTTNNSVTRLPKLKRLAMAASVCFVVFMLSLLVLPKKSAMAEMNQLIAELQDVGDRLYQITVTPLSTSQNNQRISSNNQRGYKKSAAKWLDGASLYVRNQSDYLLMYQTQHGTKLKASNVKGSWKLNEQKKLQQYNNDKGSKLPLSGQAAEMALMDFQLLLNTLKNSYELKYQSTNSQNNLSLLTATRLSSKKGVKQVQIYYQADSYLIEKITFDRVHLQGQPETYRIDLRLQKHNGLAPEFFQPHYHLEHQ